MQYIHKILYIAYTYNRQSLLAYYMHKSYVSWSLSRMTKWPAGATPA